MEKTNKKECPKCKSIKVAFFGTAPEIGDIGPGGKYPDPLQNPPVYKCLDCGELFVLIESK